MTLLVYGSMRVFLSTMLHVAFCCILPASRLAVFAALLGTATARLATGCCCCNFGAGGMPGFLRRDQGPTLREQEVEEEVRESQAANPGEPRYPAGPAWHPSGILGAKCDPTPCCYVLSARAAVSCQVVGSPSAPAPPALGAAEDPWGLGPAPASEAGMQQRLEEMMREGGCARPNAVLEAARRLFRDGEGQQRRGTALDCSLNVQLLSSFQKEVKSFCAARTPAPCTPLADGRWPCRHRHSWGSWHGVVSTAGCCQPLQAYMHPLTFARPLTTNQSAAAQVWTPRGE